MSGDGDVSFYGTTDRITPNLSIVVHGCRRGEVVYSSSGEALAYLNQMSFSSKSLRKIADLLDGASR